VHVEWILDSGCGRHLTGNSKLLGENAEVAGTQLVLSDGTRSQFLRKGTIEMVLQVGSAARHVKIEGVEYVPGFKRILLFYVALEKKGVRLVYDNERRYLCSPLGTKFAGVLAKGDVLVVLGELSGAFANAALVCSVVERQVHVSDVVHADTLYNCHTRFGHQSYDAIEALAAKPGSGIKLTDHLRPNCMTCAEGKQTKNRQSKKDSGENSPIDRVGGVICSDLRDQSLPLIVKEIVMW
jgi:hypothetical protein